MGIFCLMRVESSLDGSVCTDSSRMSRSSSYGGSYVTIKSLRLIGTFTFLAFVQSRLTLVDLSFSLRAMTLKILLVDLFKTSIAVWVRDCMQLCGSCTNFVPVCVQLCAI